MTKPQVYIHFTDMAGAEGIAKSKELWKSSFIEGVYAVALGALSVPDVQQTKLGRAKSRDVAVYFTTPVLPDYCYPEECVWQADKIPVKVLKIVQTTASVKDLDGSLKVIGSDFVQRLAIPTKEVPDPNNPPDWFFTEMKHLIGQIIREQLLEDMEEAAKRPEEIVANKLAMYPELSEQKIAITLFDYSALDNYILYKFSYLRMLDAYEEERMKSKSKLPAPAKLKELEKNVRDFEEKIVVGVITALKSKETTSEGDGVWRIREVAAEKGYGPLLYEAVMNEIGEDWLAPDATSVSVSAKNIWKRFYDREDVQKEPAPKGSTKHFPEDYFLQYYYRLSSTQAASLYKRNYNSNPHKAIKNPRAFFQRLGNAYFGKKYRNELS